MKIANAAELIEFGRQIGAQLRGGEVFELVGDVGAGKTTLAKGIALGLEIDDDVQSPSFTISRNYPARGSMTLHHYDFYRLHDAGIMQLELAETLEDPSGVTIVEWGDSVRGVLPAERAVITIHHTASGEGREITVASPYDYIGSLV